MLSRLRHLSVPVTVFLLLVADAGAERSNKVFNRGHITRELAKAPRVEVIVNLSALPSRTRAADRRSPAAMRQRRQNIHRAQQDVLDRIPAAQVQARFRYENLASFSAEVTAAGLARLEAMEEVDSIEPVYILEPHLAQGIPLIGANTYRGTHDGAGMSIAICDTGIDYTHTYLGGGGFPNSKVIGGYDFGNSDADPMPVSSAHGTSCAGIAAGDSGTVGDYIGGVAPAARLYALKIEPDAGGGASSSAMVAAWDWCVTHQNDDPSNPIMVISTSFGGGQYYDLCDSSSPSMTDAAENAVAAGITLFVSSGNDGFCDSMGWPACISSVISVGAVYDAAFGTYNPCVDAASCAPKTAGGCTSGYYATDVTAADKVTSYANIASFLSMHAPANRCYTLDIVGATGYSTGDYTTGFGGTSAACPYAAGAAACLQAAAMAQIGRYLTPEEVKLILTGTGDDITDSKVAITKPRVQVANAIGVFPEGLLTFDSATYAAREGSGTARVTVVRAGGTSGVATVNFATADNTATAGVDYAAASGMLTWSDGDGAEQYIDVTLLNDGTSENDETFTVSLSGPSGAGLATQTVATVTIANDDLPYAEGFESGRGSWTHASGNDFDWTRNSGETTSSSTGPNGAHAGTWYIYTEASDPNYPTKTASIDLVLDFSGAGAPELGFYYHMYGSAMGTLSVDVYDGSWHLAEWSRSGQQHASSAVAWSQATVDLSAYAGNSNVTIRFRGVTASSWTSDMAVDAITVVDTAPLQDLTIVSTNGGGDPAVGVHSYAQGTSVTCAITNSPLMVIETTRSSQLVCTGWVGTGSAPATGSTTNTGAFNLNTDSEVTWLWAVSNLWLSNQTVMATITEEALDTITAGDGYTVASTADVTLSAGSEVRLEPGFHARTGSVFRAKIAID